MKNWIITPGETSDIVVSTRVRLARNVKDMLFTDKMNIDKAREVVKTVEDAFYSSSFTNNKYKTIYLWENDKIDNRVYFEKHIISSKLLQNSKKTAFIVDDNETVSIMINEEDHLRIQAISAGLNLDETYEMADNIDNLLEEKIQYTFDERLGYLTACPTNIGTGMRSSVMVHLPALTINNEINGVLNALTQVGMTLRGLYGEGSKAESNLYQISNQVTLGVSEEDILTNLKAVLNQIVNQENMAREYLFKNYKNEMEDKIYRSLGILKNAILMSSKECLSLLSNIRMGVEMGIVKEIDKKTLNNLLIDIQPANLQKTFGKKMNEKERDVYRAELIRKRLE